MHLLRSYFISSIQLWNALPIETYLLVRFKGPLLCSLTRLCHCYAVLFSFYFFFFFFGFLSINFGYWNLSIVLNCLQFLLTITIKKMKNKKLENPELAAEPVGVRIPGQGIVTYVSPLEVFVTRIKNLDRWNLSLITWSSLQKLLIAWLFEGSKFIP